MNLFLYTSRILSETWHNMRITVVQSCLQILAFLQCKCNTTCWLENCYAALCLSVCLSVHLLEANSDGCRFNNGARWQTVGIQRHGERDELFIIGYTRDVTRRRMIDGTFGISLVPPPHTPFSSPPYLLNLYSHAPP